MTAKEPELTEAEELASLHGTQFQMRPRPQEPIILWSDGAYSAKAGRMGVACLMRHGRAEKLLVEPAGPGTGNVAELLAIHRGLSVIRTREQPVFLVTDCDYVVDVLSGRKRAHANVALIEKVAKLIGEFRNIRIRKLVKGASDPENDEVTSLAARAAIGGLTMDELREAAPSA